MQYAKKRTAFVKAKDALTWLIRAELDREQFAILAISAVRIMLTFLPHNNYVEILH